MILVVNDYDGLYGRFWSHLAGTITTDIEILFKEPERIRLVCFTGGEDVSPGIYGHQNLQSHCSRRRDEEEVLIFQQAQKHKIPMTGICRGSQFLNVMCGGTMVQHLKRNHGGGLHECQTIDGKTFKVTSSHHQMSVPGEGGEVLAWADQRVGVEDCVYDGELPDSILEKDAETIKEDGEPLVRVTEALYYPEYKVFAVQHHPEWQKIQEDAPQWTLNKISELCWDVRIRPWKLKEINAIS
jgi:gamma-glutamyl-gamma-aminobutyrate hydrolase PuuD